MKGLHTIQVMGINIRFTTFYCKVLISKIYTVSKAHYFLASHSNIFVYRNMGRLFAEAFWLAGIRAVGSAASRSACRA